MTVVATTLDDSEVVRHLLFHKSLLSESDAGERINQYLALLKESKEGEHITIKDPFDRSLALAFELVLAEHMDPWDIDLARFAALYLEQVRQRPEIDLITAGRLLVMAWTILKLQSEEAKARAEPPPPPPEPEPVDEWFGVEAATGEEADYMFTHGVIEGEAPLDEKIRHHGDRKVTLFELVEALEDARREAELRATLAVEREAARALRKEKAGGSVQGRVHKEDQERDVAEVWERILGRNGHPIPITDLQGRTRDELVKTFVSVLFLARQNRVKLWQDDFPYGPIYVQNAELAKTENQGPVQN